MSLSRTNNGSKVTARLFQPSEAKPSKDVLEALDNCFLDYAQRKERL